MSCRRRTKRRGGGENRTERTRGKRWVHGRGPCLQGIRMMLIVVVSVTLSVTIAMFTPIPAAFVDIVASVVVADAVPKLVVDIVHATQVFGTGTAKGLVAIIVFALGGHHSYAHDNVSLLHAHVLTKLHIIRDGVARTEAARVHLVQIFNVDGERLANRDWCRGFR